MKTTKENVNEKNLKELYDVFNNKFDSNQISIIVNTTHSILDDKNASSFLENDIATIMKILDINKNIIYIYKHENSENIKDKYDKIREVLDFINNNEFYKDSIILIDSYISKKEYPESKYYLYDDDWADNKIKLPVNNILDNENEKFVELGFININELVGYEYKEAFIYNNKSAEKIIEYINDII